MLVEVDTAALNGEDMDVVIMEMLPINVAQSLYVEEGPLEMGLGSADRHRPHRACQQNFPHRYEQLFPLRQRSRIGQLP
jgi:hypothetical protein